MSADADVSQLSAGGAGLFSLALSSLEMGDIVDLVFAEGDHSLGGQHCRARVAWAGGEIGAIGIEFVEISEPARAAVIEYLGHHLNLLLTRAEDAFKLFFHHSLDLAALLEVDGRIITISATGAAAFGLSSTELVGKNFSSFVAPADAEAFRGACERAQLGGRTRMRLELVDADSDLIAADLAITPFRIEDLRLGCFLAGHDDRDRRAAEDEVQRLERRLIVTDAMATLGYISAGIVHDVNNPLTFILMNAEALRELGDRLGATIGGSRNREALEALLSEVPEIASDISVGAQRIADLTAELSRFTSLATADTRSGDVAAVVTSVTVIIRNLINHRARLEQSHDPLLGAVALSSGRLTQILLNLLTNAAQSFTDSNTERNLIRLQTRCEGPNVILEVIDNGPGIPASDRLELMKPFKTTRADSGGTGLGLAIAKDAAESVGGTFTIGDAEGGGTHVTVVIPSLHGSNPVRAASGRLVRITPGRSPSVLILDDELAILNAYERALKSLFEVVTTTSPTEALTLTRRQRYDVIICDVMIPGVSGLDFYDQLQAESPDLASRLIFVTGGTMSGTERGRLVALGRPVILKPVNARSLAEAVWELVEARFEDE